MVSQILSNYPLLHESLASGIVCRQPPTLAQVSTWASGAEAILRDHRTNHSRQMPDDGRSAGLHTESIGAQRRVPADLMLFKIDSNEDMFAHGYYVVVSP